MSYLLRSSAIPCDQLRLCDHMETKGAFHSTKNSGNSGFGSEWNKHFPGFHSEILGVPREVGLKFRKIGITGKFRSIRPFLLAPSFSEPGNRTQHGFQFFCSISVFRLAARPDPFPSGILPVGMTARVNSLQVLKRPLIVRKIERYRALKVVADSV